MPDEHPTDIRIAGEQPAIPVGTAVNLSHPNGRELLHALTPFELGSARLKEKGGLVTAASNDQCEQFNYADSDHQHCECYRIVIEPMPPLYVHGAPPCSSELKDTSPCFGYGCGSNPISAFRVARRAQ